MSLAALSQCFPSSDAVERGSSSDAADDGSQSNIPSRNRNDVPSAAASGSLYKRKALAAGSTFWDVFVTQTS